jgi:hypothetical protein
VEIPTASRRGKIKRTVLGDLKRVAFGLEPVQLFLQVGNLLFLLLVGVAKLLVLLVELFKLLFKVFDVPFFALAEGALGCSVLSAAPLSRDQY